MADRTWVEIIFDQPLPDDLRQIVVETTGEPEEATPLRLLWSDLRYGQLDDSVTTALTARRVRHAIISGPTWDCDTTVTVFNPDVAERPLHYAVDVTTTEILVPLRVLRDPDALRDAMRIQGWLRRARAAERTAETTP